MTPIFRFSVHSLSLLLPSSFLSSCSNWVGYTDCTNLSQQKAPLTEKSWTSLWISFLTTPLETFVLPVRRPLREVSACGPSTEPSCSVNGGVELLKPQIGSCICDRQYLHAIVLHARQVAAHGPAIDFVGSDTYVSKTFAGISVLDFLHNGSVAFFKDQPATTAIKVLTGIGFGLASAASDWIFGGCMVYDLVALAVGQSGDWRTLLSLYAVGAAGIVTAKNLAW
jgi:hypothetical protein